MNQLLFIINPIAGIQNKIRLPELIRSSISRKKFEVNIEFTKHAGHAKTLSKQAVEEGYQAVCIVGGDGSVNEAASSLVGTSTALGIIPGGSGNGLALALKISTNKRIALNNINQFKIKTIDVGIANNKYFFSNAGFGFESAVVDYFAKTKQRGLLEYSRIVANLYFKYNSCEYKIALDGDRLIEEKAFMINFANAGQYGYNIGITPSISNLSDGWLEMSIVKDFPRWKVIQLVPLLVSGKAPVSEYIKIMRVNKATVRVNKAIQLQIDGDPHPATQELQIDTLPNSLHVIVP